MLFNILQFYKTVSMTLLILFTGAFVLTNPWDEFEYAVDLDVAGKYWMFWSPDDETQTITFEVGTFSNLIVIVQTID